MSNSLQSQTATTLQPAAERLVSIDMLRGLVIVLMAVDHSRLAFGYTPFYPTDITMTTAGFFVTRWITHFCAPVFVLLAGTGAYLYGQKIGEPARLRKFLWTRGLWLIVLELTWVNFGFNGITPWVTGSFFVQVIWVIGVSMMALSLLTRLPLKWIAGFSLVMIVGHNALDGFSLREAGAFADVWAFLHVRSLVTISQAPALRIFVSYPLIPWIGVMGIGYALGSWMTLEEGRRRKRLAGTGIVLTIAFFVLRWTNLYGDPSQWMIRPEGFAQTVMSFLNTTKYPPSLLFLLMTLGPALIVLAWFERIGGLVRRVLLVFGRVPLFYYLLHIPLLALTSIGFSYLKYGRAIYFMAGRQEVPADYEPSLFLVYAAWLGISIILYPLCRIYGSHKFSPRGTEKRWLRFI